jgi:uncharacterized protein
MKIVLAGGSGSLGQVLARSLGQSGHDIVVLSRGSREAPGFVHWDGRTLGSWVQELDGADAVINLAGRSVNCRYTEEHRRQMMDSRVESARAVGLAIQRAKRPPRVWLQMSTATIYAHRFDAPSDEATGLIGGDEPDAPASWRFSIEIAQAWEQAQLEANTPATRKVALRSAVVMTTEPGAPFDLLLRMTRLGLGGPIAGGRQFVSWIHERDFARAVEFILERDDIDGAVNVAAPGPLPQREFMAVLRSAAGMPVGLPATRWMAEVGAFVLRSETELLLKSRRVVPGRLLEAGFQFEMPEWAPAAQRLVAEWRRDCSRS